MDRHDTDNRDCWLPLMDYAIKRGVSLSTLRRHIKAKKIRFKIEAGRYLIYDGEPTFAANGDGGSDAHAELRLAREEIAELKTLIALYEERLPPSA